MMVRQAHYERIVPFALSLSKGLAMMVRQAHHERIVPFALCLSKGSP